MNSTTSASATDYSLEQPLRVDYLGIAVLALWAFLRRARQQDRLGEVLHGGCPAEFRNGQVETDILRSVNISPSEAELFARALDSSMSVFGHDRLTLCHAITAKLGSPVAGWRLDEEWEMIRVAKIFLGQLERYGLTFRNVPVRTVNVCHYLFTLAKLCELGRRSSKKNVLIRYLYSEPELDWIFDRLRFGRSAAHFQLLQQHYSDNNGFGRFAMGMLRWLRALHASELTLVLTPLYWRSRAALAAERKLRDSRVRDSLLIRESHVDTVINSDETKVEGDQAATLPEGNWILGDLRPAPSAAPDTATTGAADAATVAQSVLVGIDPRDPWSSLPKHDGEEAEGDWRKEVVQTVRQGKARKGVFRRTASLLRRLLRRPGRRAG